MLKLNEEPLNLYVQILEIEELVGFQKCLLPESCLKLNVSKSIRPGDWAKCYLNHGYSIICQIFMRNFSKNLCYMDVNVICYNSKAAILKEATTMKKRALLEHIELLQVQKTPIKTLDLVLELNEIFFNANRYNNTRNKNINEYLIHVAQPILLSFKLTNNCTVSSAYLEEIGIAKIQVRSNDCADNICFNCNEKTQFNIINVQKQYLPTFENVMKQHFDLPMFEKPYEELQFLIKLAQQQMHEKTKSAAKVLISSTNKPFNKYLHKALNALIIGASGVGKSCFINKFLKEHQCNCFPINASNILGEYPGETQAELRRIFNAAKQFSSQIKANEPTVILIKQLDLICPSNMDSNMQRISAQLLALMDELHVQKSGIICLGIVNDANNLNSLLRRAGRFDREIHVSAPKIDERKQLLRNLNKCLENDMMLLPLTDKLLHEMAVHTRGYVTADLELLLRNVYFQYKNHKTLCLEKQIQTTINKLEPTSLRHADVIVQHVKVKFSNIGGMQQLKQQLQIRILAGLQQASLYKRFNLNLPKGVLLYGPPGCAKTSIAKCLAAEANMTLLSTSGAEIYSPYVGCAESYLAKLFDTARKNTPCLIFLDEIDSLVGKRSIKNNKGGGSGEVQLRILSTLLTEMDGILSEDAGKQILVVAATNRPDMIDDALMRPGRFDKLIHVPAPDFESRLSILKLKSTHMPFDKNVNLEELAAKIHNYSGADVCNLCNEAALEALRRNINANDIIQFDFDNVLENYKPSLTQNQIDWHINFEKGLI